MYEQETKTLDNLDEPTAISDGHGFCAFHCTGQHFVDNDGDEWVRQGEYLVVRIYDGHLGGWFNGEGLRVVKYPQ